MAKDLVVIGKDEVSSISSEAAVVITHGGQFHADEVCAVAMLNCFVGVDTVVRVPHQEDVAALINAIPAANIKVLDVGGKYDMIKFFDHHQNPELPSSAGLIYQHLLEEGKVEKGEILSTFIKKVDERDVGINLHSEDSLLELVSMLNSDQLWSEEQNEKFAEAVMIIEKYIVAANNKDSAINAAKKAVAETAKKFSVGVVNVVELPAFIPNWYYAVNGSIAEFKDSDILVWHDTEKDEWKAQNIAINANSFEPNGKTVAYKEGVPGAIFIHKGNFFAVFESRDALMKYLESL